MNDRSNFDRESEQYSYSGRKFWCFNCQREFSRIRIDESEVYCSRCGNICEEISEINHHPRFFNLPIADQPHISNTTIDANSMINLEETQIITDHPNASNVDANSMNNLIETQNIVDQPNASNTTIHSNSMTSSMETQNIIPGPADENFQNSSIERPIQAPRNPSRFIIAGRPFRLIIDTGSQLIITTQSPILIIGGEDTNQIQNQLPQDLLNLFGGLLNSTSTSEGQENDFFMRFIEEFLRNDPNRHGPPPASEDAISKLKEKTFEKDKGSVTCAICLEDYGINELLLEMHCSHDFHKLCVTDWLKLHNTCPICRKNIESNNSANSANSVNSVNSVNSENSANSN